MNLKPTCGVAAVFSAIALLLGMPALAQDEAPAPETWGEDARYVTIYYVQFKPGKREEGMEIVNEYFAPAAEKAKLPPPRMEVHFQTGIWDAVYVWDLEGGTSDLEWYRTENDIKWYGALMEMVGGAEEAEKIMNRWRDTIRETETQIGHYHADE